MAPSSHFHGWIQHFPELDAKDFYKYVQHWMEKVGICDLNEDHYSKDLNLRWASYGKGAGNWRAYQYDGQDHEVAYFVEVADFDENKVLIHDVGYLVKDKGIKL